MSTNHDGNVYCDECRELYYHDGYQNTLNDVVYDFCDYKCMMSLILREGDWTITK